MRRITILLVISIAMLLAGCSMGSVDWSESDKVAMQSELTALSKQNSQLSKNIEEIEKALATALEDLEQAKENASELANEKSSLSKQLEEAHTEIEALEQQIDELSASIEALAGGDSLLERANTVLKLLKEKDFASLGDFVSPEGLLFSPYGHIAGDAQVFAAADLVQAYASESILTWGNYVGSGDPIEATFKNYYEEFVYNANFVNSTKVGNNIFVGGGITLYNFDDVFPGSSFVEYHFPSLSDTPGWLDWASLHLIFVKSSGEWLLAAVVHDSWAP